jgi:hypothetical protein
MIYTNPIALRFCTHSKIIQMYVKNTTNTVFCSFLFVGVYLQEKLGFIAFEVCTNFQIIQHLKLV